MADKIPCRFCRFWEVRRGGYGMCGITKLSTRETETCKKAEQKPADPKK